MTNKLKSAASYPEEIHLKIIKSLRQTTDTYSYTALYRKIKEVAETFHIKLGINKSKMFAKYYYESSKYIIKNDFGFYIIKPL